MNLWEYLFCEFQENWVSHATGNCATLSPHWKSNPEHKSDIKFWLITLCTCLRLTWAQTGAKHSPQPISRFSWKFSGSKFQTANLHSNIRWIRIWAQNRALDAVSSAATQLHNFRLHAKSKLPEIHKPSIPRNAAKHSPRLAIYMKCVRPRWPMKVST